jgi:hypothetical protein
VSKVRLLLPMQFVMCMTTHSMYCKPVRVQELEHLLQQPRVFRCLLALHLCTHAARLQQLNDVRYQRLMKCEQKSRGIRQVAEWLQQEKAGGRFDGPVYGPVCLEVNMRAGDRLWPQYFEQACGGHLNNFVCSTR